MTSFQNSTVRIGANTKYIISTSGRLSSQVRYQRLLQDILELDIAYIPINDGNCGPIEPQRFAYALKGMPCVGGAISRDIKNTIIPYLDSIDDSARFVQSVNTVIVRNGKLIGYNTDALGFRHAIVKGIKESGLNIESATCFGYGGVTSVVVHVLHEIGVKKIFIVGRNLRKADARAKELTEHFKQFPGDGFAGFSCTFWSGEETDLFVNASPATDLAPLSEAPNFLSAIKGSKIAFDHQMPGEFLQQYCKENNIPLILGTEMYYPQMYCQWELFLKELDIPALKEGKELRAVLPEWIKSAEN
jgi:shikimate 5-dehydrogenase